MVSRSSRIDVVIAGGGVAAAEAALALRAYAADRVDIEIVAPDTHMPFRPGSAVARFTSEPLQRFALHALAEQIGARFVQDRVETVGGHLKRLRLASGAARSFDVLVLALGARARTGVPGAIMFRDQRDAAQLQAVIDALRRGELRTLALAVPPGATWTLPAYELALLAAADVQRLDLRTEIALVTPEPVALAAFGGEVSRTVAGLLADRGVKLICSAAPRAAERGGLRLYDGDIVAADRVVALPVLVGQRISGLPLDHAGFVQTQARGCVVGMPDVYAAGDMTSFAVKQGGLAAQQADAIAALIATRAGASPPLTASTLALRSQLFGAPRPLYFEATLDARGRPVAAQVSARAPWWPTGTLFGRHVTPWMAQQALARAAQGERSRVAQT